MHSDDSDAHRSRSTLQRVRRSIATVTYFGLPVVGFAAETFINDAIIVNGKSYLSTFGAEFVHHKTTKIQ